MTLSQEKFKENIMEEQRLVLEQDAERYRQLFEIMGGARADLQFRAGCSIAKRPNGTWVANLEIDKPVQNAYHEAAHQLFDSLGIGVTALRNNRMALEIWNVMEDRRIEHWGGLWFSQPLYETHRELLLQEIASHSDTMTHTAPMVIANHLYNLGLATVGPTYRALLDRFRDRINAVTQSLVPMDVVTLALEIAVWLDDQSPLPDDAEDSGDSKGSDIISGAGGSVPEHKPSEQLAKELPMSAKAKRQLSAKKGRAKRAVKILEQQSASATERASKIISMPLPYTDSPDMRYSDDITEHGVRYLHVPQQPTLMTERIKLLLDAQNGGDGYRWRRAGMPTNKIWQLGLGNTRVFHQPPRHQGGVAVLVDLSGSMNCWCGVCAPSHTRGALAFQVAGAIAQCFPDMTLHGFCSDEKSNYIVPLTPGHQPLCRHTHQPECPLDICDGYTMVPDGNPDCAALLWFAEYVAPSINSTVAVIISDGQPDGPFPLQCIATRHTSEIARSLQNQGLRYVHINVGTTSRNIYPADIDINIGGERDLYRLQDAIDYLHKE